MTYKGYTIITVFTYSDGTCDFNVFAPNGDYGYIEPRTTLEKLKEEIDEKTK